MRRSAHGEFSMLAAASRLLPAAAKFIRQIIPPVVATLIAAGLISAYNRAFSGHLQQPRMAALHDEAKAPHDAVAISLSKPFSGAEPIAIYDEVAPRPRLSQKDAGQDAGKDQLQVKMAEPAAAPVRSAAPREKAEPRVEMRRMAAIEPAPQPARTPAPIVGPAPVIVTGPPVAPPATAPAVAGLPTVQELRQPVLPPPHAQAHYQQPPYATAQVQQPAYPPPVIMAQPMVTVPDRPRPIEQAQVESSAPPQGTFGRIVDTLKPSSLFARAREFGERIEQAGNDILPNIRQ
jgi:hypothetical protein